MSYRDPRKSQIESHHRVLSYDITKHTQQYQAKFEQAECSSSNFANKNNFNQGQGIAAESIRNDSCPSQVHSDNETEDFIRTEFSKYQVRPMQQNFKLFKQTNSKNNAKSKEIEPNQGKSKQQKTQKPIYQTTFFQIQIEDKLSKTNPQRKIQQKQLIRKSEGKDQQKALQSSGYCEIEQLQRAIMQTLRQKEKQMLYLQNELTTLNEQKLLNFSINQQLDGQMLQVKKKSFHIDQINSTTAYIHWKPQTVEQMKLLIDNQRLNDQLAKLQHQEHSLKALHQDITDQQTLLKETLQKAFKTRKHYIKSITGHHEQDSSHSSKLFTTAQNTQLSRHTALKPKLPYKSTQIHSTLTISKPRQSNQKPTNSKPISEINQKQILLKLLQDFNQLKTKVDESFILHSKNKPRTKSYQSTQIKPKRKVVFNNL